MPPPDSPPDAEEDSRTEKSSEGPHLDSDSAAAQGEDLAKERQRLVDSVTCKPSGHSWRTFYQKVASTVGCKFDFQVISGRTALEQWLDMSEMERESWKSLYKAWSCAPSTPPKIKAKPLESPESQEKQEPPKARRMLSLPVEPQFETRVKGLENFHKRWGPWKPKLKEATPSFFLQNAQTMHLLYLDVVSLLQCGHLTSNLDAEKKLHDYRINRLKLAKAVQWLESQQDASSTNWAPKQFSAGRHGAGFLSIPQKKDLLRHVVSMSISNRSLFPYEVKRCMYKMWLLNASIISTTAAKETDLPWDEYESYAPSMEHCYKDFRQWVRENAPADWKLINKKTVTKTAEEAADISPCTINLHVDLLQALLEECGLLSETGALKKEASTAIWCCDEKGLTGAATSVFKHAKAVSIRSVPASKQSKEKSFGHVTLLPFVSLAGDCSPPYIFVKGTAKMHAWSTVWPSASVMATENGSCTAAWFVQVLGLFGQFVREDLKVNPQLPVVLLLDSGGGGQLHITPEASLVAEHFSIRLFFFRKNMTPAVCALDQRPNQEAEKRWHQILAKGSHELSPLGALHCAREVAGKMI